MDSIALFLNSSDEEDISSERKTRACLRGAVEDIMELPDETFIKNFRLNKAAFSYVLEQMDLAPNSKSFSISSKVKLAACLRFFAEGNYQHGVGKDFHICIAQSTFSEVLKQVLDMLERKLCPKWISLKMTQQEKTEAKRYFYEKCRIPGVVMCVDGTHVAINTLLENPHLFYNRRGFYSINTMIICDSKQWIRCVDAQYPGSNHDSFIWNSSAVSDYFLGMYQNGDRNTRLLADAGYPHLPWLLTPYRSVAPNSPKSKFNEHHSRGRNVVERTIGVLKNRFRCLLGARAMHYTPKKAVQIINVCCALHNICMHFKALWIEAEEIDDDTENDYQHDPNTPPSQYANEAAVIRDDIMRSLTNSV